MSQVFFTDLEKKRVTDSIAQAELATSGEIRVHLEPRCKEDVMDRAAFIFKELEMHKTHQRNGVLFYLSHEDQKLAILGDAGINAKVPTDFWENIKNHMVTAFKDRNFVSGLSEGIQMAGEQLKVHFPYQKGDENELSNEISFGKGGNEKS